MACVSPGTARGVAGKGSVLLEAAVPSLLTSSRRGKENRRDELGRARTRTLDRLHRLVLALFPGGAEKFLSAAQGRALMATIKPRDIAGKTRRRLVVELITELETIDTRHRTANVHPRRSGGPHEGLDPASGLASRGNFPTPDPPALTRAHELILVGETRNRTTLVHGDPFRPCPRAVAVFTDDDVRDVHGKRTARGPLMRDSDIRVQTRLGGVCGRYRPQTEIADVDLEIVGEHLVEPVIAAGVAEVTVQRDHLVNLQSVADAQAHPNPHSHGAASAEASSATGHAALSSA
jgi:hypothetical protein